MAYEIYNYNGTLLTTVADGTINTTSTSLALPGRNYAGYGESMDNNIVNLLENFADVTPPENPVRGQQWFNTNDSTMYICPADGTTDPSQWLALASTSSGGSTTFGQVTVTGNLQANNISSTNNCNANAVTTNFLTVSANANIANLTAANANITGTLTATAITSGSATTAGTLTGVWTINGSAGGSGANAVIFNTGGIFISNSGGANLYGIKCDKYMYANGDPISFAGTYSNSNVASYLPTYVGQVGTGASTFRGTTLTTGANSTAGTITGNWTLSSGSRLQSTYADLAEFYESDQLYEEGTVLEFGGDKEVTLAVIGSTRVAGVVTTNPAYVMNLNSSEDAVAIALQGRVPCKVVGEIKKGDLMVSAGNGHAMACNEPKFGQILGKALSNFSDVAGVIEIAVGRL